MSPREYRDFINDIVDSIGDIESFIRDMDYDQFESDRKTYNAVVRSIEIIGEASKAIPQHIRDENPGIPWKKMAGMRDKLVHQYFGIDNEILWQTVTKQVPELKKNIIPLLNKLINP